MKSEYSLEPISFTSSEKPPSEPLLFCSGKNQALQFCLNQKCTQNHLFTCWTINCPCQNQHQLCKRGSINSCIQIIKAKFRNIDDIKQFIEETMEKVIDDLSDFRDNLIKQVQASMKYGMLHDLEYKFLKISQKQIDSKSMTSKQASQLWNIVTGNSQNKIDKFEELGTKLENFETKILQQIYKTGKQIEQAMGSLKFKMENNPSRYPQLLKYESSICYSFQLQQKLEQMFPKKVKKIQVIFHASSYAFNMYKFKEICGAVQNTVVLALTNKDKIFGGYTPYCFFNGNNEWVSDPQKRSFLFSLSQNAKFELENEQKTIYRYADGSLIRFGCDFYIYGGANKNMCMVGYQNSYKNPNFSNAPNSYIKLNGNMGENCTLKEWEVLRVEFQEEANQVK